MTNDALTRAEQVNAVKTWRYLRLSIVAMVLGIFAAIIHSYATVAKQCLQHSISGYYYTPVRGFLVGALVAIGVCLVALKGNTDVEDVFLNLAGAFAPVIALVPTPNLGDCHRDIGAAGRNAGVGNNMFAMLVVGALALACVAWLVRRDLAANPETAKTGGYGWLAAFALWVFAVVVFVADRTLFLKQAHNVAAITMFVFIIGVVFTNARSYGGSRNRNRYALIGWLMLLSAGVVFLLGLAGWQHAVFAVEAILIALFAVFWVIQTRELWHQGLR